LFALYQPSIGSQIFAENRDFFLPHQHLTSLLRGPRQKTAITFGVQKIRIVWLPDSEKSLRIGLRLLVLTEFTNVTDGDIASMAAFA